MLSAQNKIEILIQKQKLNKALHLISNYVVKKNCFSDFYSTELGASSLDELCQKIGAICLSKQNYSLENFNKTSRQIFVYLVSKIQYTGGHNRLIREFINAQPGTHIILSTELLGCSDFSLFNENISKRSKIIIEKAPKKNFLQKLIWLQKRLLCIQPHKVYIFNHHQDSIIIAALQKSMNIESYYCHHADHHFALGIFVDHFYHIDFHPIGYNFCSNQLKINNIYIPLCTPQKDSNNNPSLLASNRILKTCTIARSNKLDHLYHLDYFDVIFKLLKHTNVKHYHVGKISYWALYKIKIRMFLNGLKSDKFSYLPYVSSAWDFLVKNQIDLYISSFPYGAGLTTIEAMGAGIPLAIHKNKCSDILNGSIMLAYQDVFTWETPDELISYCLNLKASDLDIAKYSAIKKYKEHYNSKFLQSYLKGNQRAFCPFQKNIKNMPPDTFLKNDFKNIFFKKTIFIRSNLYFWFIKLRIFFNNRDLRLLNGII